MRLVMMGTGTFAEPTLEALLSSSHQVVGLCTQPDRAVGQERGSTRQTGKGMKTIAQERGVPVYQPESINTPDGVAQLAVWQPDLLVVAAYGQILNNDVLSTAKHGGINVHASLLPKYRGAAPIAWAIYHGEKQTGVTIIRMTIHLDAGQMVAQATVDIGRDETAGELESRLAPIGAKLALDVIDELAAGTSHGIVQDQTQVTKAPKLKKENGQIDWNRDGADVCNQIRAMQPWPTAYTFLYRQGQLPIRLILHRSTFCVADDLPAGTILPAPGEAVLLSDPPEALWIAAANHTAVEVFELQPAGKRRMSAADFLRGCPLKEGDRFGPETL